MYKILEQKFHQQKSMCNRLVHEDLLSILGSKGMQIKTTMRYYYTPTQMTKIEASDNRKCWSGCGATGTLTFCSWRRNNTTILEYSLVVSYKVQYIPTL